MDYKSNSIHCCRYCGKNYIKKTNLEKHIIICEFIKRSRTPIDEEEPPSQKKMYQILLELGHKYSKLEERLNEMDKWVVKKKKKINVIEWLNNNMTPDSNFSSLIEKIIIEKEDINHLFKYSFAETIDHIFSRTIYAIGESEPIYPIFAFNQKSNLFYIYESTEAGWIECNKAVLCKFLNQVHLKLHRVFMQWKKDNAQQIADDENLSILCDKTSVKLMDVDFRQETTLNKIKTNMYSRMKTDIKALVEYEFEF